MMISGMSLVVATVPTVYGIETLYIINEPILYLSSLQQYLPFTVLKLESGETVEAKLKLQQYLPFTVLKQESDVQIVFFH